MICVLYASNGTKINTMQNITDPERARMLAREYVERTGVTSVRYEVQLSNTDSRVVDSGMIYNARKMGR